MKCDLHVHTVHSGMCTVPVFKRICRESYSDPDEVYATLKRRGMDLVTVTDHDSTDGVREAMDDHGVSQLAGNTYYRERRVGSSLDWEFHFFPAFSYGETPDGHWWNILYGLAGYTRRGPLVKARAFWIPITLSDAPEGASE